jgi:hypothetical protein
MATPRTYEHHRPVGVTIVVVLLWINAVLSIIGGIILIAERHTSSVLDQTDWTPNGILGAGVGFIIFGLITALFAMALGHGSNFVRWLIGIIALIHVAGGIWALIDLEGTARTSGIVDGIIGLIVVYILFFERGSNEFFTG